MSRPRPVYEGKTSMVTRRVHKRQLLLLDDPVVEQVIKFTLAYCALKHGIDLHAVVTEGNHLHQVDTDRLGKLPDFFRDFHSFTARQLNVYYKEHDSFWSGSPTNVVGNEDANDIIERIKYAMGNPVADGIERHGKDHRGLRMRWPRPPEVVKRPSFFWQTREQGGTVPDEVTLVFKRPPGFDDLSDEQLDTIIEERTLDYEKKMREARIADGGTFLCDVPNRKRNPRAFPKSKHTLFRLAPLIGARIKDHRLRAIARLKNFRADHDQCMDRLRAGETGVVFPHGTFGARRRWNVDVRPAPS